MWHSLIWPAFLPAPNALATLRLPYPGPCGCFVPGTPSPDTDARGVPCMSRSKAVPADLVAVSPGH